MRPGIALAALCAATTVFAEAPSQPAPPQQSMRVLATINQSIALVQGDHHVALSTAKDWVTFADGIVKRDAKTAAALIETAMRLPGHVAWGATPLVFTDREMLRVGELVATQLPGERQHMVAHGDLELWRYQDWAALARAGSALTPVERLPPTPTYDKVPAQLNRALLADFCDRARPFRIAWAPTGVAAWFHTCHVDASTTIVTYTLDGKRTTRTMQPHRRSIEAEEFLIARDGTPLLVGITDGRYAIARARPNGSWQVETSASRMVALVATTLDARGVVWSITLTTGPDGKDLYRLMRGFDVVPLVAPDGRTLAPRELAFDADLGVVIEAYVRDGTMESLYPRWLFAEKPPAGPPLSLP